MRLKSYFAASVAEAIENARVELGPEAMLLNSREINPEQRHLGAYEVVFGITGQPLLPRRTEVVQQLFAAPSEFRGKTVAAQSSEQPAVPVGMNDTVPAWKRTLEALVSRQGPPERIFAPEVKAPAPPPVRSVPALMAVAAPPMSVLEKPRQELVRSAAAVMPPPAPPAPVTPILPELPFTASADRPEGLADELVSLRQQIERVKHSLSAANPKTDVPGQPRELDLLHAQLLNLGFSGPFSRKMADAAAERLTAFSREKTASLSFLNSSGYSLEHLQQVLVAELQSRFQVKPEIGVTGLGSRVMMLVGPPGAGKTTTLVKLAIKYGLERRLPVHLLSLDTVRVGGSEQLATFARILNVAFDALHTTTALGEALGDCRTDEVILIDCPGYAPAEMEDASTTAAFLRRNPSIDVQLVLPASMTSSSLGAAAHRFANFTPSKLLFTHLDEVDTVGAVLEHTIKANLPVSFLTDGQGIPQDLHEATKDRLTTGILNGAAAFGAA